jgi:hypothetical protein
MGRRRRQKGHERSPSWRERWLNHRGPYPYPITDKERTRYRYRVWLAVKHP